MRRRVKWGVLVASLLCLLFWLGVGCKIAQAEEYRVFGNNTQTGEGVIGVIETKTPDDGSVNGMIWDGTGRYAVTGYWSGKGMATLENDRATYEVEVVQ